MDAAGVNLVAEVSTTSPLGSMPGVATLWHELTPASTVLVGELLSSCSAVSNVRIVEKLTNGQVFATAIDISFG